MEQSELFIRIILTIIFGSILGLETETREIENKGKKKALKEAEKQSSEPKPVVQKEPKALPPSYTREYHQARYQAKKKAIAESSLSLPDTDSETQSLD